jgi:CBS domain containing-hemolysin-like protein
MDLEEVNELLDLNLPLADEYQTLGGFVLYQFQKIPVQGETLNYDNLNLTVVSAEGPRVHQIRIHRQEATSTSVEDISIPHRVTQTGTTEEIPEDEVMRNLDEDSYKDSE